MGSSIRRRLPYVLWDAEKKRFINYRNTVHYNCIEHIVENLQSLQGNERDSYRPPVVNGNATLC